MISSLSTIQIYGVELASLFNVSAIHLSKRSFAYGNWALSRRGGFKLGCCAMVISQHFIATSTVD